ncbi:MAG TPA: MazG nucleotide pyrophosphohydrolase domain-containing protein [Candidatus Bathyarchaeia archaeon]|nr:MazG nucleotide pyrophosphohydrolase domain-containing protein [Candidatus Bathyarchaeia archaeon]
MTLTLQDAQHASWKIFRKINDRLGVENGKSRDAFVIVADLLEEAGEVAAVVKGLESFRPPNERKPKETLAKELNDVLYCVFVLAEHYGLDLEESFLEQVNDHLLRLLT